MKPPRMLTRLLSGLVHPMIHAVYGLQFRLPGLLAKGFAQAATHPIHAPSAIPDLYFDAVTPATLRALPLSLSSTSNLTLKHIRPRGSSRQVGTHALDILGYIIDDDMFDPVKTKLSKNPFEAIEQVVAKNADKIYSWVDEWYASGKDVSVNSPNSSGLIPSCMALAAGLGAPSRQVASSTPTSSCECPHS